MSRWDLIVAGDLFRDVVMTGFPSLAERGEEAFARRLRYEIGGGAAITGCGLAKLGASVAAAGVVGAEDGLWIVKRLKSAGVDTSLVRFDPAEPSGLTVSVSSEEDRALFTYMGANARLWSCLEDASDALARARHIHFANAPDPALGRALFHELREAGCTISLDVGWREEWLDDPASWDLLREIDLFLPNEREAARMTGKQDPDAMLQEFTRRGVANIALKLGSSGALLQFEGERYGAGRIPVEPVDTTGAGDSFDAGFLWAWRRGESPDRCLRIATICGALSTRELGGVAGFPSRDELAAYQGAAAG